MLRGRSCDLSEEQNNLCQLIIYLWNPFLSASSFSWQAIGIGRGLEGKLEEKQPEIVETRNDVVSIEVILAMSLSSYLDWIHKMTTVFP
jgi:hypothetical protein